MPTTRLPSPTHPPPSPLQSAFEFNVFNLKFHRDGTFKTPLFFPQSSLVWYCTNKNQWIYLKQVSWIKRRFHLALCNPFKWLQSNCFCTEERRHKEIWAGRLGVLSSNVGRLQLINHPKTNENNSLRSDLRSLIIVTSCYQRSLYFQLLRAVCHQNHSCSLGHYY